MKTLNLILVGLLLISLVPSVLAENEKRDMGDGRVCIQVITPAINPANKECKEFSTPCDVPKGWKKIKSCDSSDSSSVGDSQRSSVEKDVVNAIDPKTKKCWAFKSEMDIPKGWKILKVIGKVPECEFGYRNKEEVKIQRESVKEKAKELKEKCKTLSDVGCKNKFSEFKEHAEKYYLNLLEVGKEQLEKLRIKVQKDKGATPEEKESIYSQIDDQIKKIDLLIERVRAIGDDTKRDGLVSFHGEVKMAMNNVRNFIQIEKIFLAGSGMRWINSRVEGIANKVKTIITGSRDQNIDINTLDMLAEEFIAHKNKIKSYEKEIREEYAELISEGVDVDELKETDKSINQLTRDINAELKAMQKILVEIRQEIARLGIGIDNNEVENG